MLFRKEFTIFLLNSLLLILISEFQICSSAGIQNIRAKREVEDVPYNIFPGTKWCGNGNIAKHENDFGTQREPDKCCRTHDRCPNNIVGYATKYNYKNPSAYTISHCDCDEDFRICLRNANSQTANDVASFFFAALNWTSATAVWLGTLRIGGARNMAGKRWLLFMILSPGIAWNKFTSLLATLSL